MKDAFTQACHSSSPSRARSCNESSCEAVHDVGCDAPDGSGWCQVASRTTVSMQQRPTLTCTAPPAAAGMADIPAAPLGTCACRGGPLAAVLTAVASPGAAACTGGVESALPAAWCPGPRVGDPFATTGAGGVDCGACLRASACRRWLGAPLCAPPPSPPLPSLRVP